MAFLAAALKLVRPVKRFVVWLLDGNDKSHLKRTVALALLSAAVTAVILMGFYIKHLWALGPRSPYPTATVAGDSKSVGGRR